MAKLKNDALIIKKFDKQTLWISPPQRRTVRHENRISNMIFPYVVYFKANFYDASKLYVAFANEIPNNLSSRIYFPALPNVHDDLGVCMATSRSMQQTVVDFWSSKFDSFTYSMDRPVWGGYNVLRYIGGLQAWTRRKTVNTDWPVYTTIGSMLRRAGMDQQFYANKKYWKKYHSYSRGLSRVQLEG